ncbi:MAG: DUF29 domain-containing protein [Cyanobacteria bacterium P01_F01_bin.143]
MVSKIKHNQKTLYDTDYHLWLEETVKQLQAKNFSSLDWENLIEEIVSLGRSEKRRIESLLTRLFEHLLKLACWEQERDYNQNHWKREIRNFRKQINKELKTSPSLKPYLERIFEECYQDSRELVADISQLPLDTFPLSPIGNPEQVLDENWLP